MELSRGDLDSNCRDCKTDATTWVVMGDGLRRYYCSSCVQDIFRHGVSKDDLDEHPRCSICRSCGRLTLKRKCPVNECPECRSETSDDHTDEYLRSVEQAANEFNGTLTNEEGVNVE